MDLCQVHSICHLQPRNERRKARDIKSPCAPSCHHVLSLLSYTGFSIRSNTKDSYTSKSFHPLLSPREFLYFSLKCVLKWQKHDVPHNFATFEEPFMWGQFVPTLYILLAAEPSRKSFYVWAFKAKLKCTCVRLCTWITSMCFCHHAFFFIYAILNYWNSACVRSRVCMCVWYFRDHLYLTGRWFMWPHSYWKCCSLVCVTTHPFCYLPTAATLLHY